MVKTAFLCGGVCEKLGMLLFKSAVMIEEGEEAREMVESGKMFSIVGDDMCKDDIAGSHPEE